MRRLPPLHGLRAFEAAARHLHFAHAAEELGLTPTAISHQVRQLEAQLGVTLFHRYPRPVRLTEAGAALYPVLRQGFDQMAEAIAGLTAARAEAPLTVSVTLAFASRWLMPRLAAMQRATGLRLAVEADNQPAPLGRGGVDFAVRYALAAGSDGLWLPLFSDQLIPVCAPGLLAGTSPDMLAAEDILRLPLIEYRWSRSDDSAPSWRRWRAAALPGDGAGAEPQAGLQVSEELHGLDAASAGQGVVLASTVLVQEALAAGQLRRLSDCALPGRSYWAVTTADHSRRAEVEAFADWARGCAPLAAADLPTDPA